MVCGCGLVPGMRLQATREGKGVDGVWQRFHPDQSVPGGPVHV